MDNKKNETLEQRKRAQQEFLRLKKMQSGEIAPPPKPSEEAVLPKTGKDKASNFWFHYKWHVIACVFIAAVLSVLITQCMGKEKFDTQIVLFTYDTYLDSQTVAMEEYFEGFCPDFDGNGKVNVGVTSCSYSKGNFANPDLNNAMATKLQSILIAQREIVLFIVDEETFKYMNSLPAEDKLFMEEKAVLDKDFYNASDIFKDLPLPEGLMLVCRYYPENAMKTNKVATSHQKGVEFLKLVQEKNK